MRYGLLYGYYRTARRATGLREEEDFIGYSPSVESGVHAASLCVHVIVQRKSVGRWRRTPHRTYLSQRNRSSITRGAVGLSIPLVEGRRALWGAGAEPERLVKAWGIAGPVRIQEQNRFEITLM